VYFPLAYLGNFCAHNVPYAQLVAHVFHKAVLYAELPWAAARLARIHGFAANSAGGSHHALADSGAGYCVFNDLAIAANRLIAEGEADRILILDLDRLRQNCQCITLHS